MKTTRSFLMASVAAMSLALLPLACSSYSSDGTGNEAGSSGSSTATGGSSSNNSSSAGGGGGSSSSSSSPVTGGGGSDSTPSGGSSSSSSSVKPVAGDSTPTSSASKPGGSTTPVTSSASGGSTTPQSSTTPKGGSGPVGGTSAVGGSTTPVGGTSSAGGSSVTSSSTTPVEVLTLPGDVMNKASGNKVVSAHSTVRVIVSGYTGPLYQLCKGTANPGPSSCKGTTQDIGSKDGYPDVAAHDAFCPAGSTCTVSKIYDQSGQKNDLEPAPKGGAKGTPDNPCQASALPVKINGHSAYGLLFKPGMGYRTGCTQCNIKQGNGMAKGDEPTTHYWVTSQKDLVDGCCFDYGNAETTSNDDGNGTMETLYFGGGVVWGTGYGGKPGPWLMADLENGLYAGWENKQDKNISTNKPLKFDYVNGILLGDTREKNNNKGRFALLGGDATGVDASFGKLVVLYDGIRPEKSGYVPMQKQGSILLGIGGDNSGGAGGRFYEGAISVGPVLSKDVCDQLHASVVAAKYGK